MEKISQESKMNSKFAPKPLKLTAQYKYDSKELIHRFFEKVLNSWPGYKISDYKFLGGNIIEITLSR